MNHIQYRDFLAVFFMSLFVITLGSMAVSMVQRTDERLEECRVIINKSSDEDELARAYLEMGIIMSFSSEREPKEGVASFQKMISDYSQSRWTDDALWYLGKTYLFSLHDESKAILAYQTALEKHSGIRFDRLPGLKGKLPDNLTSSMRKHEIEKLKTASTQRDALEAKIKTVSDPKKATKLYFSLAEAYRSLLNFPQAIETYQHFIQRFPTPKETALAQFEIGEVYFRDKIAFFEDLHYPPVSQSLKQISYENAIKEYRKTLENYPDSEWAHQAMYRIGECYLHLKEYEKTKETCKELMNKYPGSSFALKAKKLYDIAESEHRSSLAIKEYSGAYTVVEKFCRVWQNRDYKAMYELLSQEGKVKESKQVFIKRYQEYESKGGGLAEYKLFPPIAGGDGTVIVRVNLTYDKDVPPELFSGVNRFDVIEEEENWKVKEIKLPTSPPRLLVLPGSHPGED